MANGKLIVIYLVVGLISKILFYKMFFFSRTIYLQLKKSATFHLNSLKPKVEKLDIDKMMNVTSGLESLKNKIDNLDVDKLKTVPLAVKKVMRLMKMLLINQNIMQIKIVQIKNRC